MSDIDLNIESLRSVSLVNRARMQREKQPPQAQSCIGFLPFTAPSVSTAWEDYNQKPNDSYAKRMGSI